MGKTKPNMTNALILNKNNHALLVHNCKRYEKVVNDRWEFPGGKIEDNETPEETTIREVQKELGIKIKIIKRNGNKVLGDYKTKTPEGDFDCRTYHAKIIEGEPKITELEKDKLNYFDYFSYSKLLHLNEEKVLVPNLVLALPKLKEYMD